MRHIYNAVVFTIFMGGAYYAILVRDFSSDWIIGAILGCFIFGATKETDN